MPHSFKGFSHVSKYIFYVWSTVGSLHLRICGAGQSICSHIGVFMFTHTCMVAINKAYTITANYRWTSIYCGFVVYYPCFALVSITKLTNTRLWQPQCNVCWTLRMCVEQWRRTKCLCYRRRAVYGKQPTIVLGAIYTSCKIVGLMRPQDVLSGRTQRKMGALSAMLVIDITER